MVEPALRLLAAGRGDLACGKEGNENSEDEEAGAQNSRRAGPRRPEFGEDLFGRTGEGGTSGLRDKTEEQRGKRGRNPPADDTGPLHSDGESRRTGEQSEMGLCLRSVGHDALPDVTPAGEGDRANGKHGTEGDDRQEGQRFRGSEWLELLDPSQRRSPNQPVEAHSGVCDQAEGVADPEEGGAKGGGLAAGGRKLARDGPDGQEHDSSSHHGQGEVQRGTHGDPYVRAPSRQDGDDGGCHPKRDGARPEPCRSLERSRAVVSSGPRVGGPSGLSPLRRGATGCWSGAPTPHRGP